MSKQKFIAIEYAKFIYNERQRLNQINIMEAKFTKNGKEIRVSNEQRKKWKFTGLNNVDFVMSELVNEEEP